MKLRDYQNDIIRETLNRLSISNKCIIALAGGGGKSLIASKLSEIFLSKNKYIVILTSFQALVPQLSKHLTAIGIKHNIIKSGKTSFNPDIKVTLIMEQSFHKNSKAKYPVKCDVLIKDEIHISTDKRYTDIYKFLEPTSLIGMSYTPIDSQGFLLDGFDIEDVITIGSMKELTSSGYLCQIKTYVSKASEKIDYTNVNLVAGEYNVSQLEEQINTPKHTAEIVSAMNSLKAKDKKTLVYAVSIKHAINIAIALRKDSYKNVHVVHSKQPSGHNEKSIEAFENTLEPATLVSVMSLTIGFDSPSAKLLVLCRPTKMLRLYLQIVARVSRTHPSKKFSELLDLGQCVKELGLYDEPIHLISRHDHKAKQKLDEIRSQKLVPTYEIANSSLTEVSEVTSELSLKTLELIDKKSLVIKDMDTKDLVLENERTNDISTLIRSAYEINRRIRGIQYTEHDVNISIQSIKLFVSKHDEYRYRIIKTYQKRIKNIIRESKPLAMINNFWSILEEMEPYRNENKL